MSARSPDGLRAVCCSLMVCSTIAVGLRFYTRKMQQFPLKADDVFALLAVISFITGAACVLRLVDLRLLGYSHADIPPSEFVNKAKQFAALDFSFETTVNFAVAFVKLSALLFYRRLFSSPGTTPTMDRFILTTVIFVILWLLTITILTFLQCGTHLSAYWEGPAAEDKYCKITEPFYLASPLSNLLLECWILILPLPKIIKLRTSLAKRLSVMGVFLLAFVGLGASFARTIITGEVMLGGDQYSINRNRGIASTVCTYLTVLEGGISVVAVNLPTLWYLCTDSFTEPAKHTFRRVISKASLHTDRFHSSSHGSKNARVISSKTSSVSHDEESISTTELVPYRTIQREFESI
ncbi:hypothetical protein K461DRAFT_294453 [Myriangium duriaei CBS 260.36]|uniref:Rhodopsin domain-containing protein n=1 Tax=Myriangium duriaei CBS 260.36 TaxID=1168546 RepID=A0A9P4MIY5_9PEZI|nr:hypothetical protein K461DRAFT_294453 [Myriangium duriaei CBS 260.36]